MKNNLQELCEKIEALNRHLTPSIEKDLLLLLRTLAHEVSRIDSQNPVCCGHKMYDITTQEVATWGDSEFLCDVCGKQLKVETKK